MTNKKLIEDSIKQLKAIKKGEKRVYVILPKTKNIYKRGLYYNTTSNKL